LAITYLETDIFRTYTKNCDWDRSVLLNLTVFLFLAGFKVTAALHLEQMVSEATFQAACGERQS
jgi:hypothetical protein